MNLPLFFFVPSPSLSSFFAFFSSPVFLSFFALFSSSCHLNASNRWGFPYRKAHLNSPIFVCLQAEFGDLNLASYSDSGTMVDIQVYREGTVVVR